MPNDSNVKFKTNNPSKVMSNYIITGKPGFVKRFDTTVADALVIEY